MKVRKAYKDYIRMIINRVNTITKVPYKKDPAVFACKFPGPWFVASASSGLYIPCLRIVDSPAFGLYIPLPLILIFVCVWFVCSPASGLYFFGLWFLKVLCR
jgi:hypothetical protein